MIISRRIKFSFILTFLLSILLISFVNCCVASFDREHGNFKEFGGTDGLDYYSRHREYPFVNLEGAICSISVFGLAEGLYPEWDGNKIVYRRGYGVFTQRGSAFHIGNGQFVTAAHVITPSVVSIQTSKNFEFVVPVDRVISRTITLGNSFLGKIGAEVTWENHEQDLAIVKPIGKWLVLSNLEYNLSFTRRVVYAGWLGNLVVDDLAPGVAIATVVIKRKDPDSGDLSLDDGYEVRYGRIIASEPVVPDGVPKNVVSWFQMGDVTTNLVIYPGDSGSPVFAFKNGIPVIIGVARAISSGISYNEEVGYILTRYSYFTRLDSIKLKSLEVN